jgi:DNA-binding Lrp family transcriptional regulator
MSYEITCLRFVVQIKIADLLQEYGPDGLSIEEIAKARNVDPKKLVHMMRLLATRGVFDEGTVYFRECVSCSRRLTSIYNS